MQFFPPYHDNNSFLIQLVLHSFRRLVVVLFDLMPPIVKLSNQFCGVFCLLRWHAIAKKHDISTYSGPIWTVPMKQSRLPYIRGCINARGGWWGERRMRTGVRKRRRSWRDFFDATDAGGCLEGCGGWMGRRGTFGRL